MKSMTVCVALLLSSLTLRAQDLNNFYVPKGFQNPALRTGQYVLSLTPHYFSGKNDQSYTINGQAPTKSNTESSYYDVSLEALYGLSSNVTVSASFMYLPSQEYSRSSGTTSSSTDKRDNLLGALVLSYRPQSNLELAVRAGYATGGTSGTSMYSISPPFPSTSSSGENSATDIAVSIVLLGN